MGPIESLLLGKSLNAVLRGGTAAATKFLASTPLAAQKRLLGLDEELLSNVVDDMA